jgi:pimeloyl-ACP methyl ester carboxylesterase
MYRPPIPDNQPATARPAWPVFLQDERFAGSARPLKAVVFVHGIFSSHVTFDAPRAALAGDPRFSDWSLDSFDYDFWQSIPENGTKLAETLRTYFRSDHQVTLVCHSMGGLVGRLALLQHGDTLPFVKRLIMLGTPNYGTLHTARLALLAHVMRAGMGALWAVTNRKTGIKELTELDTVVAPFRGSKAAAKTAHVEYVTIPGMYFNENTHWFQSGPPGTSRGLRVLNLAMEFSAAMPLARIALRQPHDGIVEENSVYLIPTVASRFSERKRTPADGPKLGRYVHITHPDYLRVDHVTVQSAPRTLTILKDLLNCESVDQWRQLPAVQDDSYEYMP